MIILTQSLWAVMVLLFLAGAVTYAFNRHMGADLLKRAALLLGVVLIGPSLVTTILAEIPTPVLVLLAAAAVFAAYGYLTTHHRPSHKSSHGAGAHGAERRPHVPHREEHGE